MGEDADEALLLQDEKALRPIPTVHHSHRLPKPTKDLLGAVAVVLVLPDEESGQISKAVANVSFLH